MFENSMNPLLNMFVSRIVKSTLGLLKTRFGEELPDNFEDCIEIRIEQGEVSLPGPWLQACLDLLAQRVKSSTNVKELGITIEKDVIRFDGVVQINQGGFVNPSFKVRIDVSPEELVLTREAIEFTGKLSERPLVKGLDLLSKGLVFVSSAVNGDQFVFDQLRKKQVTLEGDRIKFSRRLEEIPKLAEIKKDLPDAFPPIRLPMKIDHGILRILMPGSTADISKKSCRVCGERIKGGVEMMLKERFECVRCGHRTHRRCAYSEAEKICKSCHEVK